MICIRVNFTKQYLFRSGVGKLPSTGQIWPTIFFVLLTISEYFLHISDGYQKDKKKNNIFDMHNHVKFKPQQPQRKFYWNTDTFICLFVMDSCLPATTELSGCNRDHMASKA